MYSINYLCWSKMKMEIHQRRVVVLYHKSCGAANHSELWKVLAGQCKWQYKIGSFIYSYVNSLVWAGKEKIYTSSNKLKWQQNNNKTQQLTYFYVGIASVA